MSDFYISPTGAGDHSGSSLANAATIASINTGIRTAAATGGKVLLVADAGTYAQASAVNIVAGGTADAPVTITGIASDGTPMTAHFTGTRAATYTPGMTAGNELFKLLSGASNLSFDHIDVANTGTVFRAGADISNITIKQVTASNVGYFFNDIASGSNASATVSGLTIKDVAVNGFSRGVVHLSYDSNTVLIQDVTGDSQRQDSLSATDFAIGVHLTGNVHDVKIIRTTMANAQGSAGSYWNGDGFATERGVSNIYFEDAVASGNADGGFDLKSSSTTLVRPVAFDNAHNIRVWADTTIIDPTLLDPHVRGGIGAQLQIDVLAGGTATVTGGHISDAGSATVVMKVDGTLAITGTDIVHAATGRLALGTVVAPTTGVTGVTATGLYSVGTQITHDIAVVVTPVIPPVTTPMIVPVVTTPVTTTASATASTTHVDAVAAYDHGHTVLLDHAGTYTAGSAASDHFKIDIAATTGAQRITDFDANDMLVTDTPIYDRNTSSSNIQSNGRSGTFGLGGTDTLKIDGIGTLRYLGVSNGENVYASAATRLAGFTESTLGDNVMKGDRFDRSAKQFFFDNRLDVSQGHDTIQYLGARDVIVTTQALATGTDGKVHADANGFALHSAAAGFGDAVQAVDIQGRAVSTLEVDGHVMIGGTDYFVYSLENSAGGLANLHPLGLI